MKKATSAYKSNENNTSPSMESFVPLVRKIALQLFSRLPSTITLDDLIQAGCEGLIQAWNRFDPKNSAQASFETFAALRIRGSILDFLRQEDILPKKERSQIKKIEATVDSLRHQLNVEPNDSQIANALGISIQELHQTLSTGSGQFVSFDDLDSEDPTTSAHPLNPIIATPMEQLIEKDLWIKLVERINTLPLIEQQVLSLYYEQELNFKEISQVLDFSEPRISQIHAQAIGRLKKHFKN